MAESYGVKSITLYDKRKVNPETLLRISQAKDQEMIGVEPSELDSFKSLILFIPQDEPMVKAAKERYERATREADAAAQQATEAAERARNATREAAEAEERARSARAQAKEVRERRGDPEPEPATPDLPEPDTDGEDALAQLEDAAKGGK